MNEIKKLYSKAVQQTIGKVYEDVDRYMETCEEMPTLGLYIDARSPYIVQIWLNAWLNITAARASITDKKLYLKEKEIDFDGISRKQINQLFRNEMRSYPAFDVVQWLFEKFQNNEEIWGVRYHSLRKELLVKESARLLREQRNHVKRQVQEEIHVIIEVSFLKLFLQVRYYISSKVVSDINQYGFVETEHQTLHTFLEVMNEEIFYNPQLYRKHHAEAFDEVYESYVTGYLFEIGPEWIMKNLSSNLHSEYSSVFDNLLSRQIIEEWSYDHLFDTSIHFFIDLQTEYLSDLIMLARLEFDPIKHEEIYQRDHENRQTIEREKLSERKRLKVEEDRMIEDIFGREYRPSIGRDIQYILHIGETNTGKTFQALKRMKEASSGIYLAPLRLLALEVFDRLNSDGVPCSLKTGEEEKINPKASHISCTVEMFHEKDFYEVIVIDEAQMVADKDRGFSWFKAITKALAKEVHIVGSSNMKEMILQLLGNSNIIVKEYVRDVPLDVESNEFSLKQTKKGDALVCFSRKRVLETASILQENKHKVSMIYGSMPPETRKKQMQQFIDGETTVIVATDAIGMGLNLPIGRVVFLQNEKFDGTRRRRLTSQEVKQIAGRAGRKGLYNIGKVAFTEDIKAMTRLLNQTDEPLQTFSIAPTSGIFERFQRFSRSLGKFFELWDKFESPKGTKKAALTEERDLYETIRDSVIEARLSMMDLYGFLHMPFSSYEPKLKEQWRNTLHSIVEGRELPEPVIKTDGLE
ncbi:helicase-related protein [Bacillus sp. DJP31]|uniref:helicase-related protein n=1 Tax=Bacillus sp. DJP31 TaxID=3409789 RepID=UPI003BB52DE3